MLISNNGVAAFAQIRRCVLKFCQTDKISTRTSAYLHAKILKIGQYFMYIRAVFRRCAIYSKKYHFGTKKARLRDEKKLMIILLTAKS